MAGLATVAALGQDPDIAARVQASLVHIALGVMTETEPEGADPDGATVRVRVRKALAREVLADPSAHVSRAQQALAASLPSQTRAAYETADPDARAAAVQDSDIETTLSDLWAALAGA